MQTYAETPATRIQHIVRELQGALDDREINDWFDRPNDWLGGRPPARVLVGDLPAVLAAARADRFVAVG